MLMSEFNLRVRCMLQKIQLERGEIVPIDPSEARIDQPEMTNITRGSISDILEQIRLDKLEKEKQ